MRFLSLVETRTIEAQAKNNQVDLMKLAAEAIVNLLQDLFNQQEKFIILVGSGNNGGDAVMAALKLLELKRNVLVVKITTTMSKNTEMLLQQFISHGGRIITKLPSALDEYDVIIDGIFGIGLNHALAPDFITIFNQINSSKTLVVAIDTPSGLNPFNGETYGAAIKANYTLTFIGDKPGFYSGNGLDLVGKVTVAPLIDTSYYISQPTKEPIPIFRNELSTINYQSLKRNKQNSNKGNFGSVLIIGGNKSMHGALYLCGRAAMLCGSGKVLLLSLDKNFSIDYQYPEIMVGYFYENIPDLNNYNVIIIGPGFGTDKTALKTLKFILNNSSTQTHFIFDADALNLIAQNEQLHNKFITLSHKIITPHPKEAAKLLDLSLPQIENNRFIAVTNLSHKYQAISLLKGAGSLIYENATIYLNQTGNPALSNAGQGDTLCGIIAALIAQGMSMLDSLRLAVYLHGLSADELVKKVGGYHSILASDISRHCPHLINNILRKLNA